MNVPTPGIHYGVPSETYHSWQALSHSWMQRLRQSPAHLLDLIENGPDEPTPAMIVGTAVHCAVLEPEEFEKRYAIRDEDVNGTTKAGKEFKAKSESAGQIVLSAKSGRWIKAIARRARHSPRLAEWLHRDHQTEVSFVWLRDGLFCKCRVDLIVPGLNILVDLKTTLSGSADGFATQVARYNYHGQAAWYLEGVQQTTGETWDWWFTACEKRRPFLVNCHAMPRDSKAHLDAVAENDRLFGIYKACMETGHWPGYDDVDEIHLPEWASTVETVDSEEETPFD